MIALSTDRRPGEASDTLSASFPRKRGTYWRTRALQTRLADHAKAAAPQSMPRSKAYVEKPITDPSAAASLLGSARFRQPLRAATSFSA